MKEAINYEKFDKIEDEIENILKQNDFFSLKSEEGIHSHVFYEIMDAYNYIKNNSNIDENYSEEDITREFQRHFEKQKNIILSFEFETQELDNHNYGFLDIKAKYFNFTLKIECKIIDDSNSKITAYFNKGLFRFLIGKYAAEQNWGCILGFILPRNISINSRSEIIKDNIPDYTLNIINKVKNFLKKYSALETIEKFTVKENNKYCISQSKILQEFGISKDNDLLNKNAYKYDKNQKICSEIKYSFLSKHSRFHLTNKDILPDITMHTKNKLVSGFLKGFAYIITDVNNNFILKPFLFKYIIFF